MFQGDSITDCGRSREGYAGQLLGQGYAYHIAGRLGCEQAEAGHQFINRGIGGNRVSDLYARWNEDAIALRPEAEPDYWLFDGVHPTAAGHYLMASEWLKAVQNSSLAIN